ncbi:MAG: MFS transporter [Rickettsiaceae bacterium]|nr:MFS transporter [Rickettsiaceae bacterium]
MNRKSFIIATICTIVQYYDYHLFGFLAARISKHFFSSGDVVVQLLRTYMIMSIAVTAKPLGALILGRIGDIYGRFATIIISLSGTAIASLVISLSPGYEKIGIISAIILLVCRMCIASLVSSGTDGIRIYIFEKIRADKQCLGNGMVAFSTQVGSFLASLSAWFFSLDFMPYYSWRIAFFTGALMGFGAIILRMKYQIQNDDDNKQDPNYETYKDQNTLRIVRNNWQLFLLCAVLAGCIGSTYQFIIIFFGTYNFEILKLVDHSRMQLYTTIGVVIYMIFSVIGGASADVFGRLLVARVASALLALLSIIFSIFIAYDSFSLSMYFFMVVILPFITMPSLTFLKQSLPKVIRYRLFSLAHAFGSILISAPTAYISTSIYYYTNISWLPMGYFFISVIVMIITVNRLSKLSLA